MGDRSSIEWTDATWNPVTGCTKVSQGCKHCYAETLFPRAYPGRRFIDIRMHGDRLDQPLRWRRPRRIFVNSMSDLFHERVSAEFIVSVFATMARCPQHTFQILTKRPSEMLENMRFMYEDVLDALKYEPIAETLKWPLPNVWLGVSVEDQATADERIPLLMQTKAAVRFLSCEPLLGPIDLRMMTTLPLWAGEGPGQKERASDRLGLHWVIAGGESGARARNCHPDWIRSLRDQCVAARVPFFFKQWGHWKPLFTAVESRFGDLCVPAGSLFGWMPVGKKAAGRELDGRTWEEFPA